MRVEMCCVLDYIMHSGDMQGLRNLARLVHNPRRDQMTRAHSMSPRRDRNRC